MRCPKCQHPETRVNDSRPIREGSVVRRRRVCAACGLRFTTHEELEQHVAQVVKRDGRREMLDLKKFRSGLVNACSKRPVSDAQIEAIVNDAAARVAANPDHEISSVELGKLALTHLRKMDEVAYLRFVSIFRRYRDASQFLSEIENLIRA